MRLMIIPAALRHLLLLVLFGAITASPVHAASILVSSTSDGLADGDGCSLREALINAQTDSRQGSYECARGEAGVDVILLPPSTIELHQPIVVTSDLVIRGGSATWTKLDARGRTRIFDVQSGVTLTLRGVELSGGSAADAGAAIRVQSGGHLNAEYVVVSNSKITKWTVDPSAVPPQTPPPAESLGAGIFVGAGATANISRSQISGNEAMYPGGKGAGIYCAAGCALTLSTSTVANNKAMGSGGGVHVDGAATFEFVTVGRNEAPGGAGVQVDGSLGLFGSILADNGAGTFGADLNCAGASPATAVSASGPSLVEMPGVDCSAIPALTTRASVTGMMPADVLYSMATAYYNEAPTRVLRPVEQFFPYVLRRISATVAQCARLNDHSQFSYGDQLGRARGAGDSCDLGAHQKPMLDWRRLGLALQHTAAASTIPFALDEPPVNGPVTVNLRARPGGGIGEECSAGFVDQVVIPVGGRTGSFTINPGAVFSGPALNRPARVCEFEVEIDAPLEPRMHGATAGNTRVRIQGISAAQSAVSNPPPASYLDFKTVPVGSGGSQVLHLAPSTGGFQVLSVSIRDGDVDRFELVSSILLESSTTPGEYAPVPPAVLTVASGALGGTQLQVRCKPGVIGDFEAQLVVLTNSAEYGELNYGLRCSAAHFLSYMVTEDQIREDGSVTGEVVFTLDSPCLLGAVGSGGDGSGQCFSATVFDQPGTATPGLDYQAFGTTVEFLAGDVRKSVALTAIDDDLVEGDERFSLRVVPPSGVPYLRVPGILTHSVTIKDNDVPLRAIKAFMRQLPVSAEPGAVIPFVVSVHNRGTEPMRNVSVEIAVEQPMWIKNFSLAGAQCQVNESKRRATCSIGGVLLANLIPGVVPSAAGEAEAALAEDEAREDRWDDADWIHMYGRLVTADMTRPPTIDVSGVISVSASAGDPAEVAAVSRSLVINAPPLQEFGGALGACWLVLLLLPLRRKWLKAVGRKTEWCESRVATRWYIRRMSVGLKGSRAYGV